MGNVLTSVIVLACAVGTIIIESISSKNVLVLCWTVIAILSHIKLLLIEYKEGS